MPLTVRGVLIGWLRMSYVIDGFNRYNYYPYNYFYRGRQKLTNPKSGKMATFCHIWDNIQ